jgi:hypothetical protein
MSGRQPLDGVERRDDGAADLERVVVVLREVVGDAGDPRVDVGAAKVFGGHFLAGRGFHERRPPRKIVPPLTMTVSSDIAGT